MDKKEFNIKCVVGASLGDEGKGLMTNKFCSDTKELVLNIRHNGGFQASHTVIGKDGYRHVFHGIGAGMLNKNVDTYFDREFIINPRLMVEEIQSLGRYLENVKIYANMHCPITTFMDMELNYLRERQRGKDKHGSCGCGIYETFRRNQFPEYELRLQDIYNGKEHLTDKLMFIRDKYFYRELDKVEARKLNPEKYGCSYIELDNITNNIIADKVEELLKLKEYIIALENEDLLLSVYKNLVFEGAQGLLLDRNNTPYAPHLTPSNTGLDNIVAFLERNKLTNKKVNIEVCYVSRSYNTRHGAGYLINEVSDKKELGEKVEETTNITNDFQDSFRFGYLNLDDLRNYTRKDFSKLRRWSDAKASLCVTHMDQTDNTLVTKEEKLLIEDIDWIWRQFYKVYTSNGPKAENVNLY